MQREKCKDAQQSLAVSPSDFFFISNNAFVNHECCSVHISAISIKLFCI